MTLVTIAKNEAKRLPLFFRCNSKHVSRTVVLADVDSKDATLKVARELTEHVFPVRFQDSFSDLLNLAIRVGFSFGERPVIWLDCDEMILSAKSWGRLFDHKCQKPVMALRRRRWADLEMTKLVEGGPDWQTRVFNGNPIPTFHRRLHPYLKDVEVIRIEDGIWIEHFHDSKTKREIEARQGLYKRLAKLDQIAVEGGQSLDSFCTCAHARSNHLGAFGYCKPPFACQICGCGEFR